MLKILEYHYDAGHGWVKVPLKEIKDLNIQAQITGYSYVKGADAYLEEDCDASSYIAALKKNNPEIKIEWNEISDGDSSPIRLYGNYDTESIDWEEV